jgi:hypothetical protein
MPPQKAAALRLHLASVGKQALDFIDSFRNGLPEGLLNDPKYSFKVYLLPKVTAKPTSADIAVEFVPYDPNAVEDMEHLKKVVTLIKERQVPVAKPWILKTGSSCCPSEGAPFPSV